MNAQLRPHASPLYRPMRVIDLPAVMAIETTAYSHPWSGANFIDSLAAGYHADLCLASDGALLAYFVVMPGFEEAHLLNLTVAPARHRRSPRRACRRTQRARLTGLERLDSSDGARVIEPIADPNYSNEPEMSTRRSVVAIE